MNYFFLKTRIYVIKIKNFSKSSLEQ